MKKEFNYKNQISNTGHFSPHITDKKLVKRLDAYCLVMNINKTKYVQEAIEFKLNYDLDNLQKSIKWEEQLKGNENE